MGKRGLRWDAALTRYQVLRNQAALTLASQGTHVDRTERDTAYRALVHIAEIRPDRPTWSGDRLNTVSLRLRDELTVDLARIWPSLWLTLPDPARTEITSARADLTRATSLVGWALLYAPLTLWWWPSSLITATLAGAAWYRTHTAADVYAQLIEAAARQYVHDGSPPCASGKP